jgi:hypothetical protein
VLRVEVVVEASTSCQPPKKWCLIWEVLMVVFWYRRLTGVAGRV